MKWLERYYEEFFKFKIKPPRPRKYASLYDWGLYRATLGRLQAYFKRNPSTKRERYERRKKFRAEGFFNFNKGGVKQ